LEYIHNYIQNTIHRDKLNVANTEQDLSEPRYLTSWMWLDVAKKDEILENMFMVCACLGLGARTKGGMCQPQGSLPHAITQGSDDGCLFEKKGSLENF
jgi:hypothetical protein